MYIYVIGSQEGPFKIGITNNVKRRLCALQTGHFNELQILFAGKINDRVAAKQIELSCHTNLSNAKLRGEWFSCAMEQAISAVKQYGGPRIEEVDLTATIKRARTFDGVYQLLLEYAKTIPEIGRKKLMQFHAINDSSPEAIAAHIATIPG